MSSTALPDPIELQTVVRTTAFQLLFKRGEAVGPELLAVASGIGRDKLADLLDQMTEAGRIRRDDHGNVIGSAGLNITPDRHEIEIEGRRFWTWCAYDIFGIFGALAASGRAHSPSPPDRKVIEVRFVHGRPEGTTAVLFRPDSELMACCDNVYEQWCPNSNLFSSRELAEGWASAHDISGRVLSLDEGADLATEEWKTVTAGHTIAEEQSNLKDRPGGRLPSYRLDK